MTRVLVFTRTKRGANKVAEELDRNGVRADAIHGNKSQGARQRALDSFKRGGIRVLVATDIAARGIDVDGITHVINYELPTNRRATSTASAAPRARARRASRCRSATARSAAPLRAIERLTRTTVRVVERSPVCEATQRRTVVDSTDARRAAGGKS